MKIWQFSQMIINWQHTFGRNNLPWQKNNDPYYIWVSEIMLQQTQVKTVIPYFNKFISVFPNIESLAKSNLNEILCLWSGLGYYNRARNMHKTARIINHTYNNNFPKYSQDLIKLPGIGKTTAHAILSFSYHYSFPILDSNVKRVLIRFYNLEHKNTYKKNQEKKLWNIINSIVPIHHTNKFNQGMMDLGNMICCYHKPKCTICPIKQFCEYKNIKNKKTVTKKKINNKKKCLFYITLQFKTYIFLSYRIKQTIWKKMFCFPEFYNLIEVHNWLYQNKIYDIKYKKYYILKHKFSHFTLKMICIHIILKKKIVINKKYDLWHNLNKKINFGIPKPIHDIMLNINNQQYLN